MISETINNTASQAVASTTKAVKKQYASKDSVRVAVTPAAHSSSSESDPSESGHIAPTDIGSVPLSHPDRPSDSSSSLGPQELYPKYANLPIATLKEHWTQGMIDLAGLHDWQVVAVMNMAAGKPPGLVPSNVPILTDDTGSADSLFEKYKRYSIPMLHPYYVAGVLLPKDFPETTWKEIENFHRTQVSEWNRFNQNRTMTNQEIWNLIQTWADSPDTIPEGVSYQILKEMAHFVRHVLLYLHHHYPTVINLPAPELPELRGVKRSPTGMPVNKEKDSVGSRCQRPILWEIYPELGEVEEVIDSTSQQCENMVSINLIMFPDARRSSSRDPRRCKR
jgi:hypothetical protein